MEAILTQSQTVAMDKAADVVLDIESLTQSSDISSGSPKMTKALSRKGSSRIDRRNGDEETDEASKKVVVKVASSQLEPLRQPLLLSSKSLITVNSLGNSCCLSDTCDGRNKRLSRFISIHPRKVLLMFATVSCMGTMILIYFTLAINRSSGGS